MVGATSSKGGTAGLVPAPDAGKHTSFLRGDGTWQNVPQPVIATQAEAEAGTDNTKHMTPLRVKQAIAKLSEGIPVGSILPFGGNLVAILLPVVFYYAMVRQLVEQHTQICMLLSVLLMALVMEVQHLMFLMLQQVG